MNLGPYVVPGFYTGDCRELMRALPDGSVQCVVTSPPYWGLRRYAGEQAVPWDDGGVTPYGNEPTPEEYVAHTVEILREVRRVLRDDGVCFWNVGDSYASSGVHGGCGETDVVGNTKTGDCGRAPTAPGLKQKDLVLIPHRVALAAQADGWYVRSDIIWAKPNPMPESVTDRPTSAHEHIWLLTKSARYFWDADGVREDYAREYIDGPGYGGFANKAGCKHATGAMPSGAPLTSQTNAKVGSGRNIRNVWTIPTTPYKGSYYDFESADYVDFRGIPHRWSPSCPVHEQDGRLRPRSHEAVSCDGPQENPGGCSGHTNGHPGQVPRPAASPIGDCKTSPAEDSPSCGQHGSSPASSKPGVPDGGAPRTSPRTNGTPPEPVEPTPDCSGPSCSPVASGSNSQTHKNVRGASPGSRDNASAENPSRTQSTLPLPDAPAPSRRMSESSTGHDNDRRNGTDGITCHSVDTSSVPYSKYKCECTVCQVSHFAVFPPRIPETCIKAGSKAGDLILDPFCGSGTTCAVAEDLGRLWLGFDISAEYRELQNKRTEQVSLVGDLLGA